MENQIKSKNIELSVKTRGAELFSIKVNGVEYIWNKKEIWAKSSPVLFPFVGTLKDGKYYYKDKEYILESRHGFARDNDFILVEKTDNKMVYRFSSNDETKKVYPFDFELNITYEITNDSEVKISYDVVNKGNDVMYFSLGTHPAFIMPSDYNDYYIKFDKKEDIVSYKLKDTYIDDKEKVLIKKDSDTLEISDKLFEIDSIILDGLDRNESILIDKKSNRKVHVKHSGFPYIAYWRPQKSSFICIEPWFGITDMYNTNNKLEDKKGIQKLEKACKFSASISFKFE